MAEAAIVERRGVLAIGGTDRIAFLQGIVSNDVAKTASGRAIWAAFLTPQGKYLHDFFLLPDGDRLLLEGEAERLPDLAKRLRIYKLRSKVEIEPIEMVVAVAWGADALGTLGLPEEAGALAPLAGGLAFVDPRLPALGARLLLPPEEARGALEAAGLEIAPAEKWDRLRIGLGVPDGSRDLEVERSILLESGFDELGGVDWDKGCYLGQELTARTRYRGLVKKRLVPVAIEGPAPEPGTPVLAEGKEAGVLRSSADGLGLALLRLEHLEAPLMAGEARLTPRPPAWLKLAAT